MNSGSSTRVHRRAEHRRHHAHLRTPLRVDERIQTRRQHGERRAEQIDLQICVRIDKRILARAEEKQQRPLDGVAKRHQRQRRNQQQRIHRALNLQSVRLILPPARHRENRRAARTVQAGERRHDGNDGENQADAGQRQRVAIRQVAQKNAVYNVVEQLHNLRQGERNRLRHDARADAAL